MVQVLTEFVPDHKRTWVISFQTPRPANPWRLWNEKRNVIDYSGIYFQFHEFGLIQTTLKSCVAQQTQLTTHVQLVTIQYQEPLLAATHSINHFPNVFSS